MRGKVAAIAADSLFLTLELNQLDEAAVESALAAHPPAARWAPWLRRVRAGKPHELMILEDENHYFTKAANRTRMLEAIEAFLAKNLPVAN